MRLTTWRGHRQLARKQVLQFHPRRPLGKDVVPAFYEMDSTRIPEAFQRRAAL
jgi:hypothetical protein